MDVLANTRSVSLRFVVVAGLIALLMVPLALVGWVANDRQQYYREAARSIAHGWGAEQRVAGPMLVIPVADEHDGERHVVVLPEQVEVRLDSRYEIRRRGIFELPVFHADVSVAAVFAPFDAARLADRFGALRLDQAALAVDISDPRGVRDATLLRDGGEVPVTATSAYGPVGHGLRGVLGAPASGGTVELDLALRGSGRFATVPIGDQSTVTMTSTWPHPSFNGYFLPDAHAISASGFTASWTVNELARGFPRVRKVGSSSGDFFAGKDLGFSVAMPVDLYTSTERSIKYGVLFIVLTLVGVLCVELLTGARFHFVQYGVAGVALVLFFMTLLALAEHVGFALGYAAAAVLLTGMIAWYAHGSTGNRRLTLAAAGVLAALYGVLYVLLRLESYALLVGTALLLATLLVLMRATRNLTSAPPVTREPAPPE